MASRIRALTTQVIVVAVLSSFWVTATAQDDPCDRGAKAFKLKIKVRDDIPTAVVKGFFGKNADDLHVCRGDTIEWKLSNKKFFVEFPDGSPLDSSKKKSKNGKIVTTVSPDAKRGVSYKYDVGIDGGGKLDPMIIID